MAATKELFKGYKHSDGAWAMIVLHQETLDLLDLEKFGSETIIPDRERSALSFETSHFRAGEAAE